MGLKGSDTAAASLRSWLLEALSVELVNPQCLWDEARPLPTGIVDACR